MKSWPEKALRKAFIWACRLLSSTIRPGQTRLISSSLVTTAPLASISAIRTSKARPPSGSGRPPMRSSRCRGEILNRPNSKPSEASEAGFMVSDCSRPFQANSDLFLRRRRIARPRTRSTRRGRIVNRRHPTATLQDETWRPGFFRRCVDFRRARTSFEQRTFATRLQRWVRELGSDVDTAFARLQPGITRQTPDGSTAPDRREVAMTMSEYEERFRPPAASLYQTLTVASGRNAGRRRRRIWVVAAAIGVLAITWGAASHHAVHGWTSSHSRTTAFYGQRLAVAVSEEFSVFPCWKAASSANETAGDPGTFAVSGNSQALCRCQQPNVTTDG